MQRETRRPREAGVHLSSRSSPHRGQVLHSPSRQLLSLRLESQRVTTNLCHSTARVPEESKDGNPGRKLMPKGARGCLGNAARAQEERSASTLPSRLIFVWPDLPSHRSLLRRPVVLRPVCWGDTLAGVLCVHHGPLSWLFLTVLCLDGM